MKALKEAIKNLIPNPILTTRLPSGFDNQILFTFDDGPHQVLTHEVLKRLERMDARAVFFLVGAQVEKYPHIVRDIADAGHVIGNHTYTHGSVTEARFHSLRQDIRRCQEAIAEVTGDPPKLFRSPGGLLNLTVLAASIAEGLTLVLWSNAGNEWHTSMDLEAEAIAERLENTLEPRQILLLHDNNTKVPRVLDLIAPGLVARGLDLRAGATAIA